jgi:hypothetical protein
MRIAIYTGMFKQDQDGATKTIYRLVDALLRAGNEVAVFGFSITPQRRPGLHLITLPSMPFPLYRDYRLALATPRILRILDGYGPDLIQVTVPDLAGWSSPSTPGGNAFRSWPLTTPFSPNTSSTTISEAWPRSAGGWRGASTPA